MKKRVDGRFCKKVKLPDGTIKYFYSSESTEARAERDIQKQLLNYRAKEEKGKLLLTVTEEWQAVHYKDLAYTTSRRYDIYVNAFNDYFDKRYIKDITAVEIEHFMQYLSAKQYSSKTIKDQLSVIKLIFKYALIHRYIENDVSSFISPEKGIAKKTREALTDIEILTVENSINCTFGLLAYFLLYTGLRKGEALALQWKDIDFENNVIHVNKSIYFESNNPHIKQPKTEAGKRDVILLDCLAKKLKKGASNDYVFGNKKNPINKSYFTRQWEKYKKESGLNITAHQLRHTYATILFEADIKEKDAQALMGHSDIRVTQNIYTHIRQSRMPETANKLNDYLAVKRLSNA